MKLATLGLVSLLLLTGCGAEPSKALEPLWQICMGVKYLEDRSYAIQDNDLKSAFSPLIKRALDADPGSTDAIEMSNNLDGAFEIGRLTKEVNIRIESFRYSNRPTEELAAETKKLSEALAKSQFPEAITELCTKISEEVSKTDFENGVDRDFQTGLDAYIKGVQEAPYEVEYRRSQAEGEKARSAHIAKYGNDMSRRIDYCNEKALPKYIDEFRTRGGYGFRTAQIEDISSNFIFWCYGNP